LPTTANVVEPRTVVVAVVVGVAVTTVSAAVPGRRAATIPPMAALRDQDVSGTSSTAVRGIAGVAGLVLAALLVTLGALRGGDGLRILGLGAIVGFLALAVVGPVLTGPVCRVLGRPLTRFRGVPGVLARENAIRNPRRTAATASALMIGIGLVAFVTVFAASVRAAVASTLDTAITADLAITGTGFRGVLTADVARRAAEVPGVAVASGLTVTRVLIDGTPDGIVGIDPAAFTRLADVDVRAGSLADLGEGTIAVARSWADEHGLELGGTLPITFPRTGEVPMRVVAIYDRANVVGTHLLSVATLRANVTNPFDIAVLVKSDGDPRQTRLALQAALRDDPTVEVQDRQELIGDRTEEVDQLVGLVYALLFLAVLIALLGIVNTLALSVLERTREIGLLRAVGMSRAQVRTAVRWEAVLITLLGTVLGLAVGTALGVVTVRALADEGLDRLAVPTGTLVALAIGGALFGVIGAVLPAHRASRLDVLHAIAVE
jgi:putative ABC transport system permease protein